jgi:hypothetical protein
VPRNAVLVIDERSQAERDTEVLKSGSDQQKLALVTRLVAEGIRDYQHSGSVVCCGSATLAERLRTKIATALLNGKRPSRTIEGLVKKIASAIEAEAPKVKKVLPVNEDPDYGPFALTSFAKRYPGQKRKSLYGLCPDARYNNPHDAFEQAAIPATSLPGWQTKTPGSPAGFQSKRGTPYAQSNSQFTLLSNIHVGDHVLSRVVGDQPVDESFGGPTQSVYSRPELKSRLAVETVDSLDERFFWDARENGLVLVLNRNLALGITARKIVETALAMSQERISELIVNKPKRASRAKVPAFPKWSEVAERLKLHPRTAQIAIQALKVLPAHKLFELAPAGDSL